MHILFLTDNFPPEVNAPASRSFEHCREWVKLGHTVTVITGAPNFPKGEVYPGYTNKLRQVEELEGIKVIRVWTYITANEGFVRRILDYMSFMVTAFFAALFVNKPALVIGTSPQFFTACAACLVGIVRRIPFVFELRDIWPESVKAVGAMEDSLVLRMFENIEMYLYRKAALIVSVTKSFKQTLIGRGIDGNKIKVVTNGVDIARFNPRPKDEELVAKFRLSDTFVAGYIGTHGMAHALETLLQAADSLQKTEETANIRILLLGHGAQKKTLISKAEEIKLGNVIFIDSVSKEEVARYWSLLDVSIIHLKKTPLFTTVIPSKLFECMGMGIPVLHGVAGESAGIVEREHVGLTFEPENSEELVEKLLKLRREKDLYREFRQNALDAAHRYDRSALAGKMLHELEVVERNI